MKVEICSRQAMEELLKGKFPRNTAVISFSDPKGSFGAHSPIKFGDKAEHVFNVAIHDIDLSVLPEFGLTYETYFPEADSLAKFIIDMKNAEMDIICQCEYGESRSSGCAAAILEYFYGTGISIFTDYRYYPNQVVYHKVYDALKKAEKNI